VGTSQQAVKLRVVFDTNVVLSALRFQGGQLAWLRGHWAESRVVALASAETIAELIQVMTYPKFGLGPADIQELLGDYLPHVEVIPKVNSAPVRCRDADDQKFVDLAVSGKADVLVSGDKDLQALSEPPFAVESPAEYRKRFSA
jgi:putative PIN family toxin of toxin-antitoxin system